MDSVLWAVGRVSGVAALLLLTMVVVLGVLVKSGRPLLRIPRFSVSILHRNMSLLSVAFVLMHIATLLFDSYAHMTPVDVIVPFVGTYRPLWQGLGTMAFDLSLALLVTGLLRNRVGQRAFRLIHWLAYVMWPLAMLHAIGNGTNGTEKWFLATSLVAGAAVVAAVAWRLSANFLDTAKPRRGVTG